MCRIRSAPAFSLSLVIIDIFELWQERDLYKTLLHANDEDTKRKNV